MIWYDWKIGWLAWSKNRDGYITDMNGLWKHWFWGFWRLCEDGPTQCLRKKDKEQDDAQSR